MNLNFTHSKLWMLLASFLINYSISAQVQLGQTLVEEASGDEFGESLAMNGDGSILAIGAILNDGNGNDSGSVQVFAFNDSSNEWEQMGQNINGQSPNDFSGTSVSLNPEGNIVAIGGVGSSVNGALSGQVRVFAFAESSNQWIQIGGDINGENAGDRFGGFVRLNDDGNVVVIGADSSNANGVGSGEIRVFAFNETEWFQLGQTIVGEVANGSFGLSVDVNNMGNIIAASAPFNGQGVIRAFEFNESNEQWEQRGQSIIGENPADFDGFRIDLNAEGDRLATGSPFIGDAGDVRVFQFNEGNSQWEQFGQNIEGTTAGDGFGTRLEINAIGNVIAIGSANNDDVEENAGLVRIFSFNETTTQWEQIGEDINGEFTEERASEVTLSDDGSRVAIGSPFSPSESRVRIFDLSELLDIDDSLFTDNTIEIFPNPVEDIFAIDGLNIGINKITVYDIHGRLIETLSIDPNQDNSINISSLKPGLYTIDIQSENNRIVKKILKK